MSSEPELDVQVQFLDLARQHAALRGRLLEAIGQVIDRGRFVLGPRVTELESRIAALTQSQHAIACGSGTDALQLALRALEIGVGDCVITTAYSFFATAEAISLVGARPVFCDIEPGTFNMDPVALERLCREESRVDQGRLVHRASGCVVRAIVPVHLFGQCARLAEIVGVAGRFDLPIVEDACQSLGAEQELNGVWRGAGSIGRIGCFSFYPTKNLSALGEGGMVVTSDAMLASRIRALRVHGSGGRHEHSAIGMNSRLDEVQAAVLLVKLDELPRWNRRRAEHGECYTRELAGRVPTPGVLSINRSVRNQFVIRVRERDRVRKVLAERGVQTEIYYPRTLALQPCYRWLGYRDGDFPCAEQACRENLALPIDPLLTDEERSYVIEQVLGALAS